MMDYFLFYLAIAIICLVTLSYIMYIYNIFDYRHRWDCYWTPNVNGTGMYNYDCEKLYYIGEDWFN